MTAAVAPQIDWEALEPVSSGPVWEQDIEGRFMQPRYTLGWQALDFAMRNFLQFDSGAPWRPTNEQVRMILWWYAVDEDGRFSYRRGVFRRMKGHGKDPLIGIICGIELLGPCRFDYFDGDEPIAKTESAPWIQIAAVSKSQTQNTMRVFPGMFTDACRARYGLEIGKEKVQVARGLIEAVTSAPETLEGGRPTLVILNETHHWKTNNGGIEQGKAISRNLAKRPGGTARALEITNAHEPGQDSWAERSYEANLDVINGKTKASGILYDSLESNPKLDIYDEAQLKRALEHARGDSVWLDIPRLVAEIYDPQTPVSMSRRFYLNQIVAAEDAWVTQQDWDACSVTDDSIKPGDTIALGFDGSKTHDSTALIAMRVSDGLIESIRIWERPKPPFDENWEVPKDQVDDQVAWCFSSFNVVAFYADVNEWEAFIDKWQVAYREKLKVKAGPNSLIGWDMRNRLQQLTRGVESLQNSIVEHVAKHVPDKHLDLHVVNARRRPNKWGVGFGKESKESPRKVDGLAATVLAHMARRDFLAQVKPEKKRHGMMW